jgi:hypothetical protein
MEIKAGNNARSRVHAAADVELDALGEALAVETPPPRSE